MYVQIFEVSEDREEVNSYSLVSQFQTFGLLGAKSGRSVLREAQGRVLENSFSRPFHPGDHSRENTRIFQLNHTLALTG